ncbi:hypothetical protein [Arsenicibacter rosenii]|nr:hypothetical protein [Arsenicibacter rosenii]
MKTFATSLMIALSLGFATVASADDNRSAATTATSNSYRTAIYASPYSPSTLRVNVEKQAGKALVINIKDKQNNVLASQYITKKSGTFSAKFDLSQLEDGTYHVEVISDNEVTAKSITLKTTSIDVKRSVSVNI